MFPVLCPDGVDRLKTRHQTEEEALSDAGYFRDRRCSSWSGDFTCPGGVHTIRPLVEEPEELAWVIDLAV